MSKHDQQKTITKAERVQKVKGIFSLSGKRINPLRTMRTRFSFAIFVLFSITGVTTALLFWLLSWITVFEGLYLNVTLLLLAVALSSIIIGTVISAASTKIWLGRLTRISQGMREIAKGNFSERLPEKDKKEAITEIGDLERSFNQMARDLDGIELFRKDFINNFSHEFKTPIVSIRGFARQLQGGNLTEEQGREYIDIIVTESERLATMSSNVLTLTRLENQSIVSDKNEFFLDEQIRTSILLLEKEWSEKNIELDIDLKEIKYLFNEEMMSHVWINLLSNAIKFTPDGGNISCLLECRDGKIVFEITDSGSGMTDEVKERIFEKFYQGDTSHSGSGNGIGLNIVQRVLTLAGGSIAVESQPDKGSKFTVILPIY